MNDSFAEKLASAVVRWSHHHELASWAHDCVDFCLDAVTGCTFAALSQTGRKMRLIPLAASGAVDDAPWERQLRLREGPSFHAAASGATISASALDARDRWPRWSGTWTRANGYGAVRAFPLHHEDTVVGVLELWTRRPEEAARLPGTLPAHVGAHFATVRRHEHLHRALSTRTVVGQAQGMVMERFGLGTEAAFAVLRRLSQHQNVKLSQLAEQLVTDRVLDGLAPDGIGGDSLAPSSGHGVAMTTPHPEDPAEGPDDPTEPPTQEPPGQSDDDRDQHGEPDQVT